jgi:hypothetical protein
MKVRLSRVLAGYLDGIDVRNRRAGDVLDLPDAEAQLLIAEQWAIPERRSTDRPPPGAERRRSEMAAGDGSRSDHLGD